MSYLRILNVTKRYSGNGGISDIDIAIERGESVCLLGASGCGKTTLLRVIAGLVFPDKGSVCINGRDITNDPPHVRDIGIVFQTWALFPHLTVFKNVEFGLQMRKIPAADRRRRVEQMLSLVGLSEFSQRKPGQLSGGQQQRVALARALAINPSVLLLDEPMSSLDFNTRVQLRRELRELQRQLGVTTIYVTHDYSEALAVADRTILLRDGILVEEGPTRQLFDKPKTLYGASFLGLHNVIPADIARAGSNDMVVTFPGDYTQKVSHDAVPADQAVPIGKAHICVDQWSPRFTVDNQNNDGIPCKIHEYIVEHGYTRTVLKLKGSDVTVAIRSAGISEVSVGAEGRLTIDWTKVAFLQA